MPHSTTSGSYSRESSVSRSNPKSLSALGDGDGEANSGLEKFPDHIDAPSMRNLVGRPFSPGGLNGYGIGLNGGARLNGDRWMPAAARGVRWGPLGPSSPLPSRAGHGPQKSIGDAFRTIRERRGSVSQNAHEIADALKAPVSAKLIVSAIRRCSASTLSAHSRLVDPMYHVVHVFRPDQYLLQVHLECFQ